MSINKTVIAGKEGKMNSINSNYQFNFKGLVPKAQYSGTPKLSKPVIREINRLKECLTETDKEITELENNISNPDNRGLIIDYLTKRLEIFRNFRKNLADDINIIKEQGRYNYKEHYKMFKEHSEEVEKLEDQFARASKHPDDPFMMIG